MYILGFDCGGTSTQALLATVEGRVLARGRGGPANFTVNGTVGVVNSVLEAIDAITQNYNLDLRQLQDEGILALGISGAGRPQDFVELSKAFQAKGFSRVVIHHDASIALLGALSGSDGVIVIAGTGSIAYGVRGEKTARVGGWGYFLGDEGSGFWIAVKALQNVLWSYDGRAPQDHHLQEAALQYFNLNEVEQLIPVVYRLPLDRGFIAGFSKIVASLASAGHTLCQNILNLAGHELAHLALAALDKLNFLGMPGRVGACGGVFTNDQFVLAALQAQLKLEGAKQVVTAPDFQPVVGAVLLGAQTLALDLDKVVAELRLGWKE